MMIMPILVDLRLSYDQTFADREGGTHLRLSEYGTKSFRVNVTLSFRKLDRPPLAANTRP